MKTVSCFPWRAKIAALALLVAWFAGPDDGRAQFPAGLTCQKPLPPEGHVTSNPIACTVSCANGGTATGNNLVIEGSSTRNVLGSMSASPR